MIRIYKILLLFVLGAIYSFVFIKITQEYLRIFINKQMTTYLVWIAVVLTATIVTILFYRFVNISFLQILSNLYIVNLYSLVASTVAILCSILAYHLAEYAFFDNMSPLRNS